MTCHHGVAIQNILPSEALENEKNTVSLNNYHIKTKKLSIYHIKFSRATKQQYKHNIYMRYRNCKC
jgi:hypothetical protein